MKRKTILIKQCHAEYVKKYLALREIAKQAPNNPVLDRHMSKWACLMDLMTKLNNSVIAEERRKQNGDKGQNQNS